MGLTIKAYSHGQTGRYDPLTQGLIDGAKGVVIRSDIDVDADVLRGKPLVNDAVRAGIVEPDKLIKLALSSAPVYITTGGRAKASADENVETSTAGIGNNFYTSLMNGVRHNDALVVRGGVLTSISFFWGIYRRDPN